MHRGLTALALILMAGPALAAPKVVTSIMPVHSIVSAVMAGVGEPELLLQGKLSEHRANFTPQQVADLGKADLVFIVGHGLEAKLTQLSGSEAVNGKTFVELSGAPGVKTLPIRAGGAWEPDAHDHEDDGGTGEEEGVLAFDPHVWLDPDNAKAMAAGAAAELAKADPENAATYDANAKAFAARIDVLSAELEAELAPVSDKPFVVFHDAYQYFETHFGLEAVGSISDVSAMSPSAERLKEVRDKIITSKAVCAFREPQYDSRTVDVVIEDTAARAGVLDPIGADLTQGPGAYEELLRNLATGLTDCLGG